MMNRASKVFEFGLRPIFEIKAFESRSIGRDVEGAVEEGLGVIDAGLTLE